VAADVKAVRRVNAAIAIGLWLAIFALLMGWIALEPFVLPHTALSTVADVPMVVAFASVGALIAARRPANPIGWLCLLFALLLAIWQFGAAYAGFAPIAGLPGAALAAWVGWLAGPAYALLFFFLPLLFPDGRLPSRRWRPLLWTTLALTAVVSAASALAPGPLRTAPALVNPFGVDAIGPIGATAERWLSPVLLAVLLVTFASVVVRYRRSRTERQQIKWFLYAVGVLFVVIVLGNVYKWVTGTENSLWWSVAFPVAIAAMPAAIGVAILRHRLYDIDLLINRTLVYGATSAAIAATFWVGILALQALLGPLTSGSELAVAASTLVSFALFQPVRRRVQDAVDRRFDRSRYDAARTLDVFADRLRDEVDLDTLRADLIGAVRQTMSPAHASVWLREIER
jgi:hypothetical protein